MDAVSPPGHSRTTVLGGAHSAAQPVLKMVPPRGPHLFPDRLDFSEHQGVVELTNKFHAIRETCLNGGG
jgi:hypothetical protein